MLAVVAAAEVRGFADRRPLAPDDPLAARNRRVSLVVHFTN
jgi:flagellar motor protein MotB